ncbi:hypothetical protein A2U01_0038511, partial [Trifolium medium]|nr:hypothetical protein [Trifolium medium]
MRILPKAQPQKPKIGPEIIIIDSSDDESVHGKSKGNSSPNVNRKLNGIAASNVVRLSHRCVGSHEPTSSSSPNKLRTCSGSFLGAFEV